MAYAMLCYFF